MKIKFPCYIASFSCNCTKQETIKSLSETIACPSNNLRMVAYSDSEPQKMVLSASTGDLLYHNSFSPIITVEVTEKSETSFVSMSFELKKSVKVIMTVYITLSALFSIASFASIASSFWRTNQQALILPLCIPWGMILFSFGLSSIGLRISAKGVLKILFSALPNGYVNRLPSICRY